MCVYIFLIIYMYIYSDTGWCSIELLYICCCMHCILCLFRQGVKTRRNMEECEDDKIHHVQFRFM